MVRVWLLRQQRKMAACLWVEVVDGDPVRSERRHGSVEIGTGKAVKKCADVWVL